MPLEAAARWASGLRSRPLPPTVVHHAKRTLLDWVAATVPGGTMAPARLLTAALVDDRQSGGAALVPSGRRVPLRTAALVNGTAAHTAEVDDIFRDGVYHPGAPTVAAALAAAQDRGESGAALLSAIVAGIEISTRVAARIQPAHYRYWHTTGTVGTIGAAAAVGALLKLDAEPLAHAVANATTMAAGLQQAFRSEAMSKPLHAGHAAEAGALAALAAGAGFTGALDILDGAAGFGAAMSDGPDWTAVFDDLGEVFHTTAITVKNHACCGHTFAAIDGALELRARHGIAAQDVARIDVSTYRTAIEVAGNPAPSTEFEAKFSIPYCVAVALDTGSARLAAFDDSVRADSGLRDLTARVALHDDAELSAAFPGQRGARVRIELRDGAMHETTMPTRKGDPDFPLTDDELAEKYVDLVRPHLGEDATAALAMRIWAVDELDDLRGLIPEPQAAQP